MSVSVPSRVPQTTGPPRLLVLCAIGARLISPAVAAAQQGWSGTRVNLSEVGQSSFRATVDVDDDGNAFAVWKQNFGPIVGAHYSVRADAWDRPMAIPGTADGDGYPELVVDSTGGTVVWAHEVGPTSAVVRAARYDAATGAWSAPTNLSTASELSWGPVVSVDPAGNAMVVWAAGAIAVVQAARYDNLAGVWGAPATVFVSGQRALALDVAMDVAGNAIALWIRHTPTSDMLQAARYSVESGSWSRAVDVAVGSRILDATVAMAADVAGTATLLWVHDDVVRTVRLSVASGTIGAPFSLSSEGSSCYDPVAGVDAAGNVTAMWAKWGPQTAVESARYSVAAGAWTPTSTVFAYRGIVGRLQVAVDRFGNATAVWEAFANTDLVATARYSVTTGRWGAAAALSSTQDFAFWPRVAASRAGNVVAVWWVEGSSFDYVQSTRWVGAPAAPTIASVTTGSGILTVGFAPPDTPEPSFAPTNYEYSIDDGATWSGRTPASTVSPIRIDGLSNGVAYATRIRAVNDAGPGAPSSAFRATPSPAPEAPVGLTVQAQTGHTVTVAWTQPLADIRPTGYVLEGGLSPGEMLASLPTGSLAWAFTFGAPSGAYYIRVHAVADSAWSEPSNEIRIFVNVPAPPSAPTNLLGLVNGSEVALSWTNATGGGVPSGFWLNVTGALTATLPLPIGDTFTYANVPPGTYTLSVIAANATGISPPSNTVTLTFPGPCTGVPAAPTHFQAWRTGSTISVSWSPPASGTAVTGYTVHVGGAYVGSFATTGRTLSGATAPGTYTLSVAAANACGVGPPAPTQTVVMP